MIEDDNPIPEDEFLRIKESVLHIGHKIKPYLEQSFLLQANSIFFATCS